MWVIKLIDIISREWMWHFSCRHHHMFGWLLRYCVRQWCEGDDDQRLLRVVPRARAALAQHEQVQGHATHQEGRRSRQGDVTTARTSSLARLLFVCPKHTCRHCVCKHRVLSFDPLRQHYITCQPTVVLCQLQATNIQFFIVLLLICIACLICAKFMCDLHRVLTLPFSLLFFSSSHPHFWLWHHTQVDALGVRSLDVFWLWLTTLRWL